MGLPEIDAAGEGAASRERPERPPPCPLCQSASWWNGWRLVFPMLRRLFDGAVERGEQWLARTKCSLCRHASTLYPPGLYPRRQYQLDVVADVVATMAFGERGPTQAAREVAGSPTSAQRWAQWVTELCDAATLLTVTARIDPDASAGAGIAARTWPSPVRSQLARVLDALETLGGALVRAGVALGSRSGLGRVLEWQHRSHGDVVGLVCEPRRLSPPMALGP